MTELLDKRGASSGLRISIPTLDRLRKEGKIPYRHIGRRVYFTRTDLEEYIEASRVPIKAGTPDAPEGVPGSRGPEHENTG
jgi:excisionase family DNA binding protein